MKKRTQNEVETLRDGVGKGEAEKYPQRAGLNAKQVSDVLVLLMQKGLDVADPAPKCDRANKSHHDRFGI